MPRPNVEAERRAQIMHATCEVLSETGRHALRVSDVARRAGVSSGTVHYYFEGKHDLLLAAFEFNFQRSLVKRRELLDAGDSPWQTLRALLESYLPSPETTTAWRVWAELWAEAARDEQLRAVNEALYAEWRALVAGLVERAQDEGRLRAGDPVQLADMLLGMLDGLATQVLVGSTAMTADRMRETLHAFLDTCLAELPVAP